MNAAAKFLEFTSRGSQRYGDRQNGMFTYSSCTIQSNTYTIQYRNEWSQSHINSNENYVRMIVSKESHAFLT